MLYRKLAVDNRIGPRHDSEKVLESVFSNEASTRHTTLLFLLRCSRKIYRHEQPDIPCSRSVHATPKTSPPPSDVTPTTYSSTALVLLVHKCTSLRGLQFSSKRVQKEGEREHWCSEQRAVNKTFYILRSARLHAGSIASTYLVVKRISGGQTKPLLPCGAPYLCSIVTGQHDRVRGEVSVLHAVGVQALHSLCNVLGDAQSYPAQIIDNKNSPNQF